MWTLTICSSIVLVMSAKGTAQEGKDNHMGFIRVVQDCKQELNLSEHVLGELFQLWKMEYENLNRNVGCIIVCMSKKLNLFDNKGKLHHGNAREFSMEHGADAEVATQLVNILHECEKQTSSMDDECVRALEMVKCFRTNIVGLNWTPKTEYVIGEVLTAI